MSKHDVPFDPNNLPSDVTAVDPESVYLVYKCTNAQCAAIVRLGCYEFENITYEQTCWECNHSLEFVGVFLKK